MYKIKSLTHREQESVVKPFSVKNTKRVEIATCLHMQLYRKSHHRG